MHTLRYGNRLLRVGMALVAALIMVLHGRLAELQVAIVTPRFYVALVVSFLIALLIIYTIAHITIWLDATFSWHENKVVRPILQISLGILTPAFIDLALITIYYYIYGQNILYTGFMGGDFFMVLLLLTTLNTFYYLYYQYYRLLAWLHKKWEDRKAARARAKLLEVHYKNERYVFIVSDDILYFLRDRKNVRLVTRSGNVFPIDNTIKNLATKYRAEGFCQLNPSLLINCCIIEAYTNGKRRHTLEIAIRPEYQDVIRYTQQDDFCVTEKYKEGFKVYFQEFSKKT